VLDEPFDDDHREPRDAAEHPVATGRDTPVEVARVPHEQPRDQSVIEQRIGGECAELGDGTGRTIARDVRVIAVDDDTVWLEVSRDRAPDVAAAVLRGTLSGAVLAQ
jgi:hypothetical protein